MDDIINTNTQTATTIDQALKLVSLPGKDLSLWRIKSLGLRQVLLGLAEVQSLRLSRLSTLVYLIEQQIANKAELGNLEAKQLFALYRLTTESLKDASDYVQSIVKGMDWKDFEAELLMAVANETTDTKGDTQELREASKEILMALSQMIARGTHDQG